MSHTVSLCRDLDQSAGHTVTGSCLLFLLSSWAQVRASGQGAPRKHPASPLSPRVLLRWGVLLPPRHLGPLLVSSSRLVSSEPKLHLGPLCWRQSARAAALGCAMAGAVAACRGCVHLFEGDGILQPSFPPGLGLGQPSLPWLIGGSSVGLPKLALGFYQVLEAGLGRTVHLGQKRAAFPCQGEVLKG